MLAIIIICEYMYTIVHMFAVPSCAINWKLTVYYQRRIELPKVVWVLHALSQPR